MIAYESFTLNNGLQVFIHEDHSTPIVVVDTIYEVGARDEDPEKTGFAHLFEHLMFGGSLNIPQYDTPLEKVGGDSNAFTTPDVTNYYISLPAENLETAFWLESDRMLSLSFETNVLEIQRKVVIEEYKQRYLNQPYGDAWIRMLRLAYKKHPYSWPTIGKEITHIEQITMDDVRNFYSKFYCPANAIMVVAGKVTAHEVRRLSEKWFGNIPSGKKPKRNLPQEPIQKTAAYAETSASVPLDMIYKTFHTCDRLHPDFYTTDLLSDILGRGKSSRLDKKLVDEQQIFSSVESYITAAFDPGLLVISGKLNEKTSLETADATINDVVESLKSDNIREKELEKVKNKAEATTVLQEVEILSRAIHLAYAAVLGKPEMVNNYENIQAVSIESLDRIANRVLDIGNSNTLYYRAER